MNIQNLNDSEISKCADILFNKISSEEKEKNSWKELLMKDDKGKIINHIDNYLVFLNECPKYKGHIKYNMFLQQKELFDKPFEDETIDVVRNDCERETGLSTKVKFDQALSEVLINNSYNPVIDYFNKLEWDHKERIGTIFIDLLDADDTVLNKEMTKRWFIAAVKRVYEPGCKFDNMIVLQGNQGIGKSSICELISMNFANTISLSEIGNKDLVDKLNKTWIAIIDEMDTFNRKEMSTIKTFLSLGSDSTRLAYGRYTKKFDRKCIFIGSTNDDTFLRDSTSSVERRFWIIRCNKLTMDGKIREVLTQDYIDQLWAEAVYLYNANKEQYLDIPSYLQNDFASTMREFKTYTDDKVVDYARDILDANYNFNDKGEFDDAMDILNQYTKKDVYDINFGAKINKIPMSALLWVLKSVYHEDRSAKYLALALSDEWEYKSIRYKEKVFKGLIRKEYISNNIKEIEDELPF